MYEIKSNQISFRNKQNYILHKQTKRKVLLRGGHMAHVVPSSLITTKDSDLVLRAPERLIIKRLVIKHRACWSGAESDKRKSR